MNQTLKAGLSIALGTALVGAAVAAGYYYYTGQLPLSSLQSEESTTDVKNKRKKRRNKAASTSSVSIETVTDEKSTSAPNLSLAGTQGARLIDLPIEEINKLPADKKEQVFYGLLVEGETVLTKGKEEEAVELFVKALNMVPTPTEVLVAFEKSLPPAVFSKILAGLQTSVRKRQQVYFEKISGDCYDFTTRTGRNNTIGTHVDHWAMRATKNIAEGTVILTESPDVITPTIAGLAGNVVTSDPFGLSNALPCPPGELSADLKPFAEHLDGKSKEAYNKLLEHCKRHNTSIPLLLLRYVTVLLKMEHKAQESGSAVTGVNSSEAFFFSHYDNLRPALRQPQEADKREASLLRGIFENTDLGMEGSANVKEFLTNEIYTAMKNTLQHNALGLPLVQSDKENKEVCKEYLRWGGNSTKCKAVGIYHSIAHVDHSMEPNVSLSVDDSYAVTVKASREIKQGEFICMSFLSPEDLVNKEKRTLWIGQHFGLFDE